MLLTEYRIRNYRSVADSGPVRANKVTSLVGRNESGKSNLLLALRTLNPPAGLKALNKIKDFPRNRRLAECNDDTPVVETVWQLSDVEAAQLAAMYPRAKDVRHIEISRPYGAKRKVAFRNLPPLQFSKDEIGGATDAIAKGLEGECDAMQDAEKQQRAREAVAKFAAAIKSKDNATTWAPVATAAVAELKQALPAEGVAIPQKETAHIGTLEALAADISSDGTKSKAALDWLEKQLPVFVYVEDYPAVTGHQNVKEYLDRKNANPPQTTKEDQNFEKMCKVAGLDPAELQTLNAKGDHETRNQLANRAGAVVTTELRRLWKDRPLKVRFSPDADHLDTFVSDPNTVYDVEVNLDERSRGLKWFFSFYITFSADTKGGAAEKAVLLLDEPGLYLHALSQGDLMRHFATDFTNQIIYTTHSPFMVPTESLDSIRTVNIDQDAGTTVTDSPTGDARTLFPLQAALGFSLSQSLFVGADNLVIEGVTDFWILSCASDYLRGIGKKGLAGLTITPAGGAPKVAYMVALLASERLGVVVLLDDEPQGRAARDELVKNKLIRDDTVLFVSASYATGQQPKEADIEDVLDPAVYNRLVQETYTQELQGKALNLNANIPRIVKRYEKAFEDIGLEFIKTRPARRLLSVMAQKPEDIMTADTTARFERLFEAIAKAHAKVVERKNDPFR